MDTSDNSQLDPQDESVDYNEESYDEEAQIESAPQEPKSVLDMPDEEDNKDSFALGASKKNASKIVAIVMAVIIGLFTVV